MKRLFGIGAAIACGLVPALGSASPAEVQAEEAAFVLVLGVNQSIDGDVADLRYADDDAIEFARLFHRFGATVRLLVAPDSATARLYRDRLNDARPPTEASVEQAIAELASQVKAARSRGLKTRFSFIYAGHGNVDDSEAYVSLLGGRLTGQGIAALLNRVGADTSQLIIDACYSYYLAHQRGPGGTRRPLSGFAGPEALPGLDSAGLFLSTSAANESHEWEGFQAGIFSYEVRSGLYGAADADGDGQVTYRELAAFVERANAAIANERFRPNVYARSPKGSEVMVDLRGSLSERLEIDGARHAHYVLEDLLGVRIAEFHSSAAQEVHLVRPEAEGVLYLRSADTQEEFLVPAEPAVVALGSLRSEPPRTRSRGAAHHAFSLIFSLPFDEQVVAASALPGLAPSVEADVASPGGSWVRTAIGIGGFALGAGLATLAAIEVRSAASLRDQVTPTTSQLEASSVNRRIEARTTAAKILIPVAAGAAVAGVLVLIWPSADSSLTISPAEGGGAAIFWGGSF